jgi:hypothetical protein
MANIRYVFGILKTGTVVDEFSLNSVSASAKMNSWGTLRGSFGFDQSGKYNTDLADATVPGLCYVALERDDIPVWFGIVWSRSYQSQAKVAAMTARSLEAYPEKRRIERSMDFENMDTGAIFLALWQDLMTDGCFPLILPASLTTGNLRTMTIKGTDRKTYADVMSQIADAEDGFDWTIVTTKDASGGYVHTLLAGATLGATDAGNLSFEYPGNIINYYETASMSNAGTRITIIGSNQEEDSIISSYEHTDMTDGLWIPYDVLVSRLDVPDQPTLDQLAMVVGPLRRPPMNIDKAFVRGDADPEFGTYNLGDACRLIIKDPLHPEGVNINTRITAYNYTPTSDDSTDEVELIFEGDELND